MRNIELFGDEQRFINCMSTENKKKIIKTTTKSFNSYGHVLVGLKTEFEDHLTSLACYTCSKESLKPIVVNAAIKAKPKSSENKIKAIREKNASSSRITSQKSVCGQSKFGRLDLLPKYQQDRPSGRLSTINEIENM